MNTISNWYSRAALMVILGAAAGLGISLFYYLTPLTGVNGTIGAALVIFSTAAMLLAGLLHPLLPKGPFRFTIKFLILADGVATFAAGYFLHEWWLMVAMAVSLLGAIWGSARSVKNQSETAEGAAA